MKTRIRTHELEEAARRAGLSTQHDCGGYRLVQAGPDGGFRYVHPAGGVCPTVTKRECMIFLSGFMEGKRVSA